MKSNAYKLNIAALLSLSMAAIAQTPAETDPIVDLEPLKVEAASRTLKLISTIPQTVTVVNEQRLDEQLSISRDPIQALSQLVPSFSPSRQKMTGLGETFRGRSPLYLIDGVPQSNPLRDGSRDGYTIDPVMISRIEVIHGASAAQGLGATGGIINYVTRAAPTTDGLAQYIETGLTSSDRFDSEGVGYRAAYRAGYRDGALGAVGSVAYEWRPIAFDGDGNRIGVDNTQGDTMNSSSLDVYGKVEYQLNADSSARVFVNHFDMEQDLEYVSVNGDIAAGIPTTSVKGETEGAPARNKVTTVGVHYQHNAVAGGQLIVDLFRQDFSATYGGGRFGVFVFNGETVFDQSRNESEKLGAKVTWVRDLDILGGLGLVTGIDYLDDTTQQSLIFTDRLWVPETSYISWAPYLQLEKHLGAVIVSGGVRLESATLEVGDFTTLEAYGPQQVAGGSPGFDEWLLNIGATYKITEVWSVFGSFAQGFGMPDVGRVLRGINTPNQDVDSFLGLEPVVTDNYEVGVRYANGNLHASASVFISNSDLGTRLVPDADGIYSVAREKTSTYGVELSADVRLGEDDRIGTGFAWVEGKFDRDGDGDVDTRLSGADIPAPKLTLHWTRHWTDAIQTRLQSMTLFDRDLPELQNAQGNPVPALSRPFDGYTSLDFLASWHRGRSTITFAVENLLDEQAITYYSQTNGRNDAYFAIRGRTLSLRYSLAF